MIQFIIRMNKEDIMLDFYIIQPIFKKMKKIQSRKDTNLFSQEQLNEVQTDPSIDHPITPPDLALMNIEIEQQNYNEEDDENDEDFSS